MSFLVGYLGAGFVYAVFLHAIGVRPMQLLNAIGIAVYIVSFAAIWPLHLLLFCAIWYSVIQERKNKP